MKYGLEDDGVLISPAQYTIKILHLKNIFYPTLFNHPTSHKLSEFNFFFIQSN